MFPVDVINIIVEYAFEYELLDWVDEKNLDWSSLSLNSNAINLIKKNLDKVDWKYLSKNPNAIHRLEQNLDKVDCSWLSQNKNAIHMIEQNFEKLITMWPTCPAGIYSAGIGRKDEGRPITYAGIGSVRNKPELFGHVDIVIIDEAHLVSPRDSTSYRKFIYANRNRGRRNITTCNYTTRNGNT